MPSNHLILCRPLLLLPPTPPSIRVFSNESTLCMRWPKYWSFSFSSFQRTPRADLLQNGLVGSPCSPRDSQESSPTPQFKSINSSALSFLHSPTLSCFFAKAKPDFGFQRRFNPQDLCSGLCLPGTGKEGMLGPEKEPFETREGELGYISRLPFAHLC